MMDWTPIEGLIAAPHTPMDADGRVNLDQIENQARWFVRCGVVGAYICGSTGEGLSLTTDERRAIAERWVKVAGGSVRVIVHVGHDVVQEAAELARHAKGIGADAVSAVAPAGLGLRSAEELLEYCRAIVEGAGGLPFYYYHSPSVSGLDLDLLRLLELAADDVPGFVGVKFNEADLFTYQRCLAFGWDAEAGRGRFDVLWGVDEALLGALAVGARGAVGSTFNYAAPHYYRMMKAFELHDLAKAKRMSWEVVGLVELLLRFGVVASGKALMSMRGAECGPPRAPVRSLTDAERSEMLDLASRLPVFADDELAEVQVRPGVRVGESGGVVLSDGADGAG